MRFWQYAFLLTASAAFAQTAVEIVPGAAVAGGSGSASITITSSASNSEPSDVEWTLAYSASALSRLQLVAGPALTSARKSLSCANGTGEVRCIAWGMNTTPIGNGVLATANFSVSPSAQQQSSTLALNGLIAVSGAAKSITATATSATLTISPAAKISELTCAATSIISLGKATCTVTLTSAAVEAVSVTLGLGTNSTKVTIPSSVGIPAGASSASFAVTAGTVANNSTAVVVATLNGSSATVSLSLVP